MKIFPVKFISEIDKYTIDHEPILSVNLMERAALRIFEILKSDYPDRPILVLAGPGNNGGDALALSRMLLLEEFEVLTLLLNSENLAPDTAINKSRLTYIRKAKIIELEKGDELPLLNKNFLVIDGLFGSGLNRPLEGRALDLVKWVNKSGMEVLAIDIPSGLFGEDNRLNNPEGIIRAKRTFSFQFPKLSFLFPDNHQYTGMWEILDIGLNPSKIELSSTDWYFTDAEMCRAWLPKRDLFSHKGSMGHVLLIAGSYNKMGAAILAAKAALRAGTGLLTVQIPNNNCQALYIAVPEAMVSIDRSDLMFTEYPKLDDFSAVGVGPGIGIRQNSVKALSSLLDDIAAIPLVLDADALNIIAANPEMLDKLPMNSVLTPHPKEFERLVGGWKNDYDRFLKAKVFVEKYQLVLVLKGAFTMVVSPEGHCHFNSTGNPGMATAGSGDALTGIILTLLGRGIPSYRAAVIGVYLHGLAGDFAKEHYGEEAMIATDIIDFLAKAFKKVEEIPESADSDSFILYSSKR